MTTRHAVRSSLILLALTFFGAAQAAEDTTVTVDGKEILPSHGSASGFWLFAEDADAELALMGHPPRRAVAALDKGRRITIRTVAGPVGRQGRPLVDTKQLDSSPAQVAARLEWDDDIAILVIDISAPNGSAAVQLDAPRIIEGENVAALAMNPRQRAYPQPDAVGCSPPLRPAIEQALIEWDWRMQDGIAAPRESRGYAQAVQQTLSRGDALLDDLTAGGVELGGKRAAWESLHEEFRARKNTAGATDDRWESLWRNVHRLRREMVLGNPVADVGPLVFAKRVPSVMSHQLTQYYGYTAQPGGGVFVLEEPGRSMKVRQLTGDLPAGSYLHPEVAYDGGTIYFAFCECDTPPKSWGDPAVADRRYHLYSVRADGSELRRLTDGPYDDFSPTCLPDGKLLFISTRRGGYHRCGRGPCYVYTLATAEADGSNPHPISFHETNEWDPAVLNDGRVIYTRWDYVDRNAVFYQQLWTVRQDGSNARIYYGNNTFNPVGTWEARSVPGSSKVMATAAPHHGMTAGSIVLLDTNRGVDGPAAITRLTPDAAFPESEIKLMRGIPVSEPTRFDDPQDQGWGPTGREVDQSRTVCEEELRWPGHCYRSPWPLSEKYFLVAYSFDRLRGEPGVNLPNLFGLYLCDAFGNRELLYRDPNISSLWPIPLRPQ